MELTSPANGPPRVHFREQSLWVDFGRVGGGILLGIASGFVYGFLTRRWDAVFGLVTLVIGPILVLAALWLVTGLRWRTGMRILGATAGWLAFAWLFVQPAFNQWLLAFYIPGVVLFVTSLSAGSLVGLGLLLADTISRRLGSRTETSLQAK